MRLNCDGGAPATTPLSLQLGRVRRRRCAEREHRGLAAFGVAPHDVVVARVRGGQVARGADDVDRVARRAHAGDVGQQARRALALVVARGDLPALVEQRVGERHGVVGVERRRARVGHAVGAVAPGDDRIAAGRRRAVFGTMTMPVTATGLVCATVVDTYITRYTVPCRSGAATFSYLKSAPVGAAGTGVGVP